MAGGHDGFHVDHEALRTKTPAFAAAAERLSAAFDALQTVRDAEDGCWGADEAGTNFDGEYRKAAEEADKGRDFLTEGLNTTKKELDATADQWESDDTTNSANIQTAGGGL